MRRLLFLCLSVILTTTVLETHAQPATYSIPFGIGRGNCGVSGGGDSMFFFNYVVPNLQRATYPLSYRPRLCIGPSSTTNRFTIFAASVAFNPADQKVYYLWTNYSIAPVRTYVWRWRADTTFATAGALLDTLASFAYDIGGIAFDNAGTAWTLEFPVAPTRRPLIRPMNFNTGTINPADTLELLGGPGGIGNWIYNPGSGDITLMPNGQMYFNFDNKLYTPDYQSYNLATRQLLKCTFIDTTRLGAGLSALVALAYADGELIAGYSPSSAPTYNSCINYYRQLDPITGDTTWVNYIFNSTSSPSNGVRSIDMTQLSSGVGASKRLVSITPTGFANQYDVQYDVFTKNFGTVPITNVMVRDSLGMVNGNGNVSNVSTAFVGAPPPGISLNPAFNGTTNINLILPGATLNNYPPANSYFTIRITARFSGILSGVVYNNQATATANGFNNTPLRDLSTDGNNPDLNQNDKPDDFGESQPTPFIVTITPITPACSVLDTVLYNQDFGAGLPGMYATLPATPSASTQYVGASAPTMNIQRFTVTDSAHRGDPLYWLRLRDHTGNAGGRMLVVNADAAASIIYRDTMPVSCPGQQYSFSFWSVFIGNSNYQTLCTGLGGFRYPRFLARVRDLTTGLVITQFTTDSIVSTSWVQRGMRWVMPPGYSNVIVEILNAGQGGCGNDFAIDDIQYGICDPLPTIATGPLAGCIGGSTTFTSNLTDNGVIPGAKDYQWQWSNSASGPWGNIAGATSANYTINPINPIDTGRFYRVIVAAAGNIGNPICQYTSPGVKLTGFTSSTAATSANRNKNNVCPGKVVQLSVVGGSLGANARWYWYAGSCGGSPIDSGASINVTPSVTTTYYVRASGYCNTTACASVTVNITCDIDKDDDGLPDYLEANLALGLLDLDFDGVPNYFDTDYPGYVDINNDYIHDRFQADGDVDNDGILNYLDGSYPGRADSNGDGVDDQFDTDLDGIIDMLDRDSDNDGIPDVVEAYGADSDGDARIDNYTDTDNDGLSQNVDFNITGVYLSGLGLGNINLDFDLLPNWRDLDSDNDGIPDIIEAGAPDANNNGRVDVWLDANADGITDSYVGAGAILITGADVTSDGRADSYPNDNPDQLGRPNPYDLDADGDGIADVIEAGFPDTNFNGIVDGIISVTNGWSTTISAMPGPLSIRNSDADLYRDYLDIDSDNDGITDNIEGMSTLGYLLPGNVDTDGDGIVNTYDLVVGFGGSGIMVYDFDGDGTPDYRDGDTDADGMIDRIEGNDFNFNRLTDDNVTLTGLDSDGDGLDNRFDSSNTTPKVTSYNLGNGGTNFGDPAPGTRSVVQQSYGWQTDRDWRFVGLVLPVEFLSLSGIPQSGSIRLNWTVIAGKDVDRFEIERSIDNASFQKVGTVQGPVQLNTPQSFGHSDDISSLNNTIIYYRIKVIGKAGEIKFSNIIVVRLAQQKTPISIAPNPASEYVAIRFFAEKDAPVTVRILDKLGKTVLTQQSNVMRGANVIQVNNLTRLSTGIYTLQFVVNNDITSEKLIISK